MGKVDDLGFDVGDVEEFQTPPAGMKVVAFDTYVKGMGPSGAPFFALEFLIAEGANKGFRLYDNASTSENARFRIRRILRCLGAPIEKGTTQIKEDELKGKKCLVETFLDEYVVDGKKKNKLKINDYFPMSEMAQRMGQSGASQSDTQQSQDPKLQFGD